MPGSELPARTLSEILAPNRLMVNHTFELNVDQWKFVGHPFSVKTSRLTSSTLLSSLRYTC
ncbi:hypothetical protein GBAR_LOCUS25311 [Geodia barretti]|uniref:GATOR complex protein NPRL3 n=1 Tax=Geodia barretti TaxID=519541 RepID=A0AA35X549_GEOBA|nr:hypothetical protein GBAR_LOCUS25311 [Geodia barretti]